MSIFSFFKKQSSAPTARERLQVLLAHERASVGQSDLVALLREEICRSSPSAFRSTTTRSPSRWTAANT